MELTDDQRENQLVELGLRYQCANSPNERRDLWAQISELHHGRSPERVRAMEVEKGLRPL